MKQSGDSSRTLELDRCQWLRVYEVGCPRSEHQSASEWLVEARAVLRCVPFPWRRKERRGMAWI